MCQHKHVEIMCVLKQNACFMRNREYKCLSSCPLEAQTTPLE